MNSNTEESGFQTIKIEEPNLESSEQGYYLSFSKAKICLIIISIIFVICFIIGAIYFSINKKRKRFKNLQRAKINNNSSIINDTILINDTISIKTEIMNNNTNISTNNIEITESTDSKNITKDENTENIEDNKKETKINDMNLKPLDLEFNIQKQIKTKSDLKNRKNIKISIIVMNNSLYNEESSIDKLYESITSQTLKDIEIFIVNDYNEKMKIKNKTIKEDEKVIIVEYKDKIGKLLQRYDLINMTKGEYILFINKDDYFDSNDTLKELYQKAEEDNLDILEYVSYHGYNFQNKILLQPELFSEMYFGVDNYNHQVQFHLNGKLINRNFLINALIEANINNFYFKAKMNKYEQNMILLIIFRKAKRFKAIDFKGNFKDCSLCDKNMNIKNMDDVIDLLIYCKFLIEYTGNNVPEKRMAASIFVEKFLDRNINIINKDVLKILEDTLDLYLKCDKIGEEDINYIQKYKENLNSKKM